MLGKKNVNSSIDFNTLKCILKNVVVFHNVNDKQSTPKVDVFKYCIFTVSDCKHLSLEITYHLMCSTVHWNMVFLPLPLCQLTFVKA